MSKYRVDFEGGKDAVLLIHGLTGSPFELKPLARKLHKDGFSVKAPCLAGHGKNLQHLIATNWHDWYMTVRTAFRELKERHDTVSVAGLCMGALLALYLAYEEEGVDSVAAMSTTLFYDGWSLPWYKFMLPISYYPPFKYFYTYEEKEPYGIKNERLRKQVEVVLKENIGSIAYSGFPSQSMHELFKLIRAVKRIIHKVKVPTIILHALEDDIASIRNANYIENHIGSARVRKVFLEDSYHMLTLDNQREQVAIEMINFFREPLLNETNAEPSEVRYN